MTQEQELQNILDHAVDSGDECGCQLTVYRDGKLLYNLFAGYTDAQRSQKVDQDTLFPVFSVGKAVVSTLIHILAEKGKLSYNDPVVKYWPEYGCHGKEITTIRDIMTHRAGLFSMPEYISLEDSFNWEVVTSALAKAKPESRIGGIRNYHAYTYGVLAGFIAERAVGRPFNQILNDEILAPLNIDTLFFGLPEEKFSNLAEITGEDGSDDRLSHNRRAVLTGLNPSSNGCMNAGALAKIFASLIGNGIDEVRLLTEETIDKATVLMRAPDDPVHFEQWDKFGLGYVLGGPRGNIGRIFGHGGAVGAEVFADKETGYAVGFTKNRIDITHPVHPTRNAISQVLGLPERVW